jgi:protein TonB
MLTTLLESNAPRQRRRAGTLASICVHTAAIVGAVVATGSARPNPVRPEIRVTPGPVFVRPTVQPPDVRSTRQRAEGTSSDASTVSMPIEPLVVLSPPKPGSDRLGDVDPVALLGADPLGRVTRLGTIGGDSLGPALDSGPRTATTVDRVAVLLAPPRPHYPDQLRAAGVTGRVVVRMIVDTLGRVEAGSVAVRESSHDLFTRAVMTSVSGLRFVPAEVGGRRVRMLVDLPFEFRLHR